MQKIRNSPHYLPIRPQTVRGTGHMSYKWPEPFGQCLAPEWLILVQEVA
jgi:hypothetical protein